MRRIEEDTGQQLEPRPATPIRDRQPPVLNHSIVKSLAERRDYDEEADQKAENRDVVIGLHMTGGSGDSAETTNKTIETIKALGLAHKAGNAVIAADQINEWVYAAGTIAYNYWHERGLKSVFDSPADMLTESVRFWWQNKDDIYQQEEINTNLHLQIDRLLEVIDGLRAQLDPVLQRREVLEDIATTILLADWTGARTSSDVAPTLLKASREILPDSLSAISAEGK